VCRIGVERMVKGEVKIVRSNAKPKIINNDSKVKVADVAVAGALFLEVIGPGATAFGWYEAVG